MGSRLNAFDIVALFNECQIGRHTDGKIVQGIYAKYHFGREPLLHNQEKIQSLIDKLPDEFFYGAGASFSHMTSPRLADLDASDKFIGLAMAIKRARIIFDDARHRWVYLPGGLPMIRFYKSGQDADK